MLIELSEKEINEISKCLMLEVKTLELLRGFGDISREEKEVGKLWIKFSSIINEIARTTNHFP